MPVFGILENASTKRVVAMGLASLVLVTAAAGPGSAAGLDNDAVAAMVSAPAAELPARVADAVRRAPAEAAEIACDLLALRPDAVTRVARAAAVAAPEIAPQVAFCATEIASESAATITAAIATAVPAQSAAIVEAACRAAPEIAGEIAEAVARALPARAEAVRAAAASAMAKWVPPATVTQPPSEEPVPPRR